MDSARARLVAALKDRDKRGRFAIYHPFTTSGEPIYVHAKITIVDEAQLRIGSANLNNRSMRLDTECDVSVDAGPSPGSGAARAISAVRDGLLAKHLDVPVERVTEVLTQSGSLIQTIERLRRPGRSLKPYEAL